MPGKRSAAAWVLLGALVWGTALYADEIRLRDGSAIHGKIVAELDGRAYIQTDKEQVVSVPKSEILEVRLPKAAPAPAPPPPASRTAGAPAAPPSARPAGTTPEATPAPTSKPAIPEELEKKINALLNSEDPAAAIAAVAGDHPAYLHWLARRRHADGRVAEANSLLRALGRTGNDEALPRLRSFLDDTDVLLRAAAVSAAAEFPGPASLSFLSDAVRESEPAVAEAALAGLYRLSQAGIQIQDVVVSMTAPGPIQLRLRGVEILGRFDEPWATQRMQDLLDDPEADVRRQALRMLEPMAQNLPPSRLELRLRDPDIEVRIQACLVVGRTGLLEFVPQLNFLLGDSEPRVVAVAADALKRLTKKDFGTDQAKWVEWWEAELSKPPRR